MLLKCCLTAQTLVSIVEEGSWYCFSIITVLVLDFVLITCFISALNLYYKFINLFICSLFICTFCTTACKKHLFGQQHRSEFTSAQEQITQLFQGRVCQTQKHQRHWCTNTTSIIQAIIQASGRNAQAMSDLLRVSHPLWLRFVSRASSHRWRKEEFQGKCQQH